MSVESLDRLTRDVSNIDMIDGNENNDQNFNFNYDGPSLYNLPIEVFLNICSYLSPMFISDVLAKVCMRFKDILTDESLWRSWVSRRVKNKKFPPIDYDGDLDWEKECVYIDRLNYLWQNNGQDSMTHIVLNDKHYASVDAVLLMNNANTCISAGRDRSLAVWDLPIIHQTETAGEGQGNKETAMSYSHNTVAFQMNAHNGWVWALATPRNVTDYFYSASWDTLVKLWKIDGSDLIEEQTFKCKAAALCLSCIDENVIAVGLFGPNIHIFDKRVGKAPVHDHKIHKASILDMHLNRPGGETIYSTSEDLTIRAFDLRAGKAINKTRLYRTEDRSYALCLAINEDICPNALFAGDTLGNVHLLDSRTLKKLAKDEVYPTDVEGIRKVTDLTIAPGALMASFESGRVRIMNPTCPLNFVTVAQTITSNITTMMYENDVLAVGTCDSAVEVWIPTGRLETY